ncbi:MAG: hypothetical protein GX254_06380 [Clostridiales bacterium]|jgi:hypothetical protein|nr:hypothetical protein [Clostridiales bacterium]
MSNLGNIYYYLKIAGLYPALIRLFLLKCLSCLIKLLIADKRSAASQLKKVNTGKLWGGKLSFYRPAYPIYFSMATIIALAGFMLCLKAKTKTGGPRTGKAADVL